jgi:hypothetical protein
VKDVSNLIFGYLTIFDIIHVKRSCRTGYRWFLLSEEALKQEEFFNFINVIDDPYLTKVNGDYKKYGKINLVPYVGFYRSYGNKRLERFIKRKVDQRVLKIQNIHFSDKQIRLNHLWLQDFLDRDLLDEMFIDTHFDLHDSTQRTFLLMNCKVTSVIVRIVSGYCASKTTCDSHVMIRVLLDFGTSKELENYLIYWVNASVSDTRENLRAVSAMVLVYYYRFKYLPPTEPNMLYLWPEVLETLVKSFKTHLYREYLVETFTDMVMNNMGILKPFFAVDRDDSLYENIMGIPDIRLTKMLIERNPNSKLFIFYQTMKHCPPFMNSGLNRVVYFMSELLDYMAQCKISKKDIKDMIDICKRELKGKQASVQDQLNRLFRSFR